MGSTVPVASMVTAMSCRPTGWTGTGGAEGSRRSRTRMTRTAAATESRTITERQATHRNFTKPSLPRPSGWKTNVSSGASQIASHQRLELGLGDPLIVPGADEIAARLTELRLRRQHVEQRGSADRVTLLLHAKILLGRPDRGGPG